MHFGSTSDPSQTAAAKVKPRYEYSILKMLGQSSGSPVRPLLREAKPTVRNIRYRLIVLATGRSLSKSLF